MSDKSIHATPARYRVTADSYIDGVLYTASTAEVSVFVDYAGHPGTALEPIDEEGRRRQEAHFAARGTTLEQAQEDKRRLTQGGFDTGAPAQAEGV